MWVQTYNNPAEKTAMIPIFFFSETFSCQTDGTGRIKIAKSDRMLNNPVA